MFSDIVKEELLSPPYSLQFHNFLPEKKAFVRNEDKKRTDPHIEKARFIKEIIITSTPMTNKLPFRCEKRSDISREDLCLSQESPNHQPRQFRKED